MSRSALAVTRAIDDLLREIGAHFSLLAAVTPRNAAAEHQRLVEAWSRGETTSPRWQRPVLDPHELAKAERAIDRAETTARELGRHEAWLDAYADRLREVRLELDAMATAFTHRHPAAAAARMATATADEFAAADALAQQWSSLPSTSEAEAPRIRSDDGDDPRSLLSQLRARIASERLPVRVLTRPRVGGLAAAGDGVVIVAEGAEITEREGRRVVVHEVDGHLLPRERAKTAVPGLCRLGSAGAADEEEGRALCLEEDAGLLHVGRKRSLAIRHLAASWAARGASFVDIVQRLRTNGTDLLETLSTVQRVMRGAHLVGHDVFGGLGRERVYLPAYLRIRSKAHLHPHLFEALGHLRLSLQTRDRLGL